MDLGTIAIAALVVVLCLVGLVAGSYLDSGDWLWKDEDKKDRRNWPPPR
jgi:hypothetical protein